MNIVMPSDIWACRHRHARGHVDMPVGMSIGMSMLMTGNDDVTIAMAHSRDYGHNHDQFDRKDGEGHEYRHAQ